MSCWQVHDQPVQRARHAIIVDNPFGKRPSLVRTLIVERVDVVLTGPEHSDLASNNTYPARTPHGDIIEGTNVDPSFHARTSIHFQPSTGASSLNS